MLTTQLYIKGFAGNEKDGIWKGLGGKNSLVTTEFKPIKESKIGELAAHFEIVLGATPEDPKQDQFRGGPPPRRG